MATNAGVQDSSQTPLATGISELMHLAPPAPEGTPRRNATRRARWLVLFVYLAMLATNGWLIVEARVHTIAQAHLSNTNLVRAVTERIEGTISEADHILAAIVYELEQSEISPLALERLQPILVNHVAHAEQLKGLFVYDADGNWIATSEPRWEASWNNADRAYFIHHRNNPSTATLVGVPLVSRSSGEWIVPVSRRLDDADGRFAGVALATVSIRHLRGLLERLDISEGAILVTLSGHMVARRPSIEADIGKPLPASPLNQLYDSQRSGTADVRSPIDGVVRLLSFEHARNYPLRITVAASKDEVLRNWRITSVLQTLWIVFLCLVLELAASHVRRTIRHRLKAEAGLREASEALAHANERLAKLAQDDGLTGLPNRRTFDQRLRRAFRQAQRERNALAIAMIDVDEFKKYNDHYGHVEGDECLRRVAAALRTAAQRPHDVVARYGGEEMVLLLPQTDAHGAMLVAEAAREAVARLNIAHAASALGRVTVSIGVASLVPNAADTESALLKAADAALYASKHHGRNRVSVHA